jgi:NAD-dependent deacetylase
MIAMAAELLGKSTRPVVFTGAGMSSESGMRTFRGKDGYWKQYSAMELASVEGLTGNPALVWQWYRERFMTTESLEPHGGYHALTLLEQRKGELPVVTQNIDGFHIRAGQTDVLEIHGSMRTVSCFGNCGYSCELTHDLVRVLPPLCPSCGGLLRPDIVLFGEPLPHKVLSRACSLAEQCDLMLVIGTTVKVWPAAGIPFTALESGARIIEINPERSELPRSENVVSLRRKAGEILPVLVEMCERLQ